MSQKAGRVLPLEIKHRHPLYILITFSNSKSSYFSTSVFAYHVRRFVVPINLVPSVLYIACGFSKNPKSSTCLKQVFKNYRQIVIIAKDLILECPSVVLRENWEFLFIKLLSQSLHAICQFCLNNTDSMFCCIFWFSGFWQSSGDHSTCAASSVNIEKRCGWT
jgi:hypothetical protein